MFKKYRFEWDGRDGRKHTTDFFVHSRAKRTGFIHEACAIGELPRLDDMDDWGTYRANEDKLFPKRVCKVSYCNRTWEVFPGQTCLSKLWEQLSKLKFLDMGRIHVGDPFAGQEEPDYESLYDPEDLFGNFRR